MRTLGRTVGFISMLALLAGACGGGGESAASSTTPSTPPSTPPSTTPADGTADVPTADSIDASNVDGEIDGNALEATIAEFTSLDTADQNSRANAASGELERQLYLAFGLQDALGGATDAAGSITETAQWMTELGAFVSESVGSLELGPQGFRGAPARAGDTNIGEGLFGGMVVTMLGSEAAVSATNDGKTGDADVGDASKAGEEPPATIHITVTEDGVELTTEASFTDSKGVTTTLKTRNFVAPCPKPDGTFEASATIDTSSTVNNGATGKRGTFDVTVNGSVDDDAAVVGYDSTTRSQYADFADNRGGFVDLSVTRSRSGETTATFNRGGGTITEAVAKNAISVGALVGAALAGRLVEAARKGWESGRCVALAPTTSAGPKGLDPSATVTVTAAPRSKIDGGKVGGNVTAQLTGGAASVAPSGTKVPADATFTYVAPADKGATGTVALEARSKRGVGRASIVFDTAASPTVHIAGPVQFSLGGLQGSAVIDLTLVPDPDDAYTGTADLQITGAVDAMQTTCALATWNESIDLMATLTTENDEPVLVISTIGDPPRGTPVATTCTTAGIALQSQTPLMSSSLFGEVHIPVADGPHTFTDSIATGSVTGTVTVSLS